MSTRPINYIRHENLEGEMNILFVCQCMPGKANASCLIAFTHPLLN